MGWDRRLAFPSNDENVAYPPAAMRRPAHLRLGAAIVLGGAVAVAALAGSSVPAASSPGALALASSRDLSARTVTAGLVAPVVGAIAPATPHRAARGPAGWIRDLDDVVAGHHVSVAVGADGVWLYRHGARTARPPASNEKLLLSMAVLDRFAPRTRIRTQVYATGARSGPRLRGSLWIVGRGDPEVDKWTMRALARAVREEGIRKVRGRVMGATTGFLRDWWAHGWRDYFPEDYIPLPTALTFDNNEDAFGRNIRDPERRAASSLKARLKASGVRVTGDPGAGPAPDGLRLLATVESDPFEAILKRMNRRSRNFHAEVLGKWLGGRVLGGPGSIPKGARVIERFAARHEVEVVAYDSSGLSYANRVRPQGLVELLWYVGGEPWAEELRISLPTGGQGTLEGRLKDVRVRAKTGTLEEVSALSGWVWLEQTETWGQFSILSQGMSKPQASAIEDRIVRIVAHRAQP
jgi:serine-type D-Ala-D-Ala carboxypeptidase/endopeptidase (penicillin-binding protein 4)